MKLYRTVEDLRDEAARLQALADKATDPAKAAAYQHRADKFTRRANTATEGNQP
jgi:hypothetical protein